MTELSGGRQSPESELMKNCWQAGAALLRTSWSTFSWSFVRRARRGRSLGMGMELEQARRAAHLRCERTAEGLALRSQLDYPPRHRPTAPSPSQTSTRGTDPSCEMTCHQPARFRLPRPVQFQVPSTGGLQASVNDRCCENPMTVAHSCFAFGT